MKVIRKTRKGEQIDPEIRSQLFELVFEPLFAVIEVFSGELVIAKEVTSADRLSNCVNGHDLRRVENFRSR